ncbi:hypothetical protein OH76DRAFT_779264 [Lentinus brumalis]|uniref:Uncharacterized protein n=1 Tax=Lentinus brumalis TaxID=2498619 RepID=A0A371D4H6_9APHY|nr:hypothetical protein OH76DRAFT_779264 [Polyporus brumalis]
MLAGVAHFAHDTYRNVVAVQKDRSRSQCDLASMRVCQGVCEPDLGTKCYHISMTVSLILILQSSSCTTYTNSIQVMSEAYSCHFNWPLGVQADVLTYSRLQLCITIGPSRTVYTQSVIGGVRTFEASRFISSLLTYSSLTNVCKQCGGAYRYANGCRKYFQTDSAPQIGRARTGPWRFGRSRPSRRLRSAPFERVNIISQSSISLT